MSDRATPPALPPLAVEYVPTHEDILHGRRFLFRRTALFHPTVLMFNSGSLLFVAGAVMMGTIGSALWLIAACFGFLFVTLRAMGFWKLAPTRMKVEKEIAARPWLRTPAHVQLTDDVMVYDHGPLHARLTWAGVARVVETEHAFIVMEKAAPGALLYCLPKRELEKTAAGVRGWQHHFAVRASSVRDAALSIKR
jgi:hypothetical protein